MKISKQQKAPQQKVSNAKKSESKKYCILCAKAGLPKHVFLSHNIGDDECATLSNLDKKKLEDKFSLKHRNNRITRMKLLNYLDILQSMSKRRQRITKKW